MKSSEIRSSPGSKFSGYLAGLLIKVWSLTLRYKFQGELTPVDPEPVIFVLWHNRIFTMPPIWKKTGGKGRQSVRTHKRE